MYNRHPPRLLFFVTGEIKLLVLFVEDKDVSVVAGTVQWNRFHVIHYKLSFVNSISGNIATEIVNSVKMFKIS